MNPLDKEELSEISKIIKNDMPLHTDKTAKIKNSFSQGFPKNLMDYSSKVDNKFLNSNLAIIEEINYKNSKHWIPKAFQEYQNKIYGNTDILNHDNFFKAKLHDSFFKYQDEYGMPKNTHYMKSMSIQNAAFLATKTAPPAPGSDITSGGTASHSSSWGPGYIWGSHSNTTGIIGSLYDRIAVNEFAASSNNRLATYDDVSLLPVNLLSETGSHASATGFPWVSVTEYSLTTAQTWIAYQNQTGNANIYWQDIYSDNLHNYGEYSHPYGTYSSVFVPVPGGNNQLINMKIGHS